MKASRLLSLPPYLFEDLENKYREAVSTGRDVIDLSVGDPDLPPPASLVANLKAAVDSGRHHQYPPQRGLHEIKASIRRYLGRRAGVEPADDQILILVGSKEGIAHLPWAICNPGDRALVPDPGYPVYHSSVEFAGCEKTVFPLEEGNGFLPELGRFDEDVLRSARLCFLNYPNNPTSATAGADVFATALELSSQYDFVIVNDAAYADVYFDDKPVPLMCSQPRALERPMIEFFSFSKTFCITGWRAAFAVGNRAIIEALAHIKANIDSGTFGAVQEAVAKTLDDDGDRYAEWMRGEFQERRDLVTSRMNKLGFKCFPTYATFYIWAQVPSPWKSMDYALHLLEKSNVLVTPGVGFGAGGEGYFRIALTCPNDRLDEALDRVSRL